MISLKTIFACALLAPAGARAGGPAFADLQGSSLGHILEIARSGSLPSVPPAVAVPARRGDRRRDRGEILSYRSGNLASRAQAEAALSDALSRFMQARIPVIRARVLATGSFPIFHHFFLIEYASGHRDPVRIYESGSWTSLDEVRRHLAVRRERFERAGFVVIGGSIKTRGNFPIQSHSLKIDYAARPGTGPGNGRGRLLTFRRGSWNSAGKAESAMLAGVAELEKAGFVVIGGRVGAEGSFPYQTFHYTLDYTAKRPQR